jgi:hypothetical protein
MDDIKMDLKEIGCQAVDLFDFVQGYAKLTGYYEHCSGICVA